MEKIGVCVRIGVLDTGEKYSNLLFFLYFVFFSVQTAKEWKQTWLDKIQSNKK